MSDFLLNWAVLNLFVGIGLYFLNKYLRSKGKYNIHAEVKKG